MSGASLRIFASEGREGCALPAALTPLLGRERDQAVVVALYREHGARLVTLLGPPGVGKSRLAQEIATSVAAEGWQAVQLITLTPGSDPQLVGKAIAAALATHEAQGASSSEELRRVRSDQRRLLVLDALEHPSAVAGDLAVLLARHPGLALLVTSRAPLRIPGEQIWRVDPLFTPDPIAQHDLAALAAAPAIQLFVSQAQAVDQSFALTEVNASAVAAICARLDGLPVALERAAAWMRLLTPEALLRQLNTSLGMLTDSAADMPGRTAALFGTIARSYDLLTTDERRLLQQLSFCKGGWSLPETAALAGQDGYPLGEVAALRLLASLYDHSLIQRATGDHVEPRFFILQTVQAFAREQHDAAEAPEAGLPQVREAPPIGGATECARAVGESSRAAPVEANACTAARGSLAPGADVPGEALTELTGREVEVLGLVAAGFSNPQIAEQLIISPRTVHAHMRTIFSKLSVTSRSAATRVAVEQGLV